MRKKRPVDQSVQPLRLPVQPYRKLGRHFDRDFSQSAESIQAVMSAGRDKVMHERNVDEESACDIMLALVKPRSHVLIDSRK